MTMRGYPVMWKRRDAAPRQCFIGCPHLTLGQLTAWTERILDALRQAGRAKLGVETYLCAAPQVLEAFRPAGRGPRRPRYARACGSRRSARSCS